MKSVLIFIAIIFPLSIPLFGFAQIKYTEHGYILKKNYPDGKIYLTGRGTQKGVTAKEFHKRAHDFLWDNCLEWNLIQDRSNLKRLNPDIQSNDTFTRGHLLLTYDNIGSNVVDVRVNIVYWDCGYTFELYDIKLIWVESREIVYGNGFVNDYIREGGENSDPPKVTALVNAEIEKIGAAVHHCMKEGTSP